ncbi:MULTISPECIES: helix-turn-helix transcriptional regulator [unclassified Streptomyces]|uniref:helix-turn-helix domain-containing protein n=1 Tax=unclassified Streptomyces TaxID=2593676 RepID=UPI001BECD107|nr:MULTISPECIES: helix-turn-helix transcriptional regulator [unclassified Streptomyces]MBT2402131.1 helix-turn-helix transcriptional regulator [Streptomyces sp. ISL-21]MBT2453597.1 helix-turn-helix transcriptional regulator [Streptomyces sp. ISL-86]MBT2609318.1 helix-turn-helix transcriptional regulator [Streptomyces sp. ISL-87]
MAKAANKETAGGATRLVSHLARAFRERERLTQRELGAMLGYSGAAISALETGAQPASDEMLIKLEAVIGGGMGVFEAARELVRLDKYPAHFQDFVVIEQKALSLYLFETQVVYGMFQTEPYARAMIAGGFPVLSDQRVEELVEARMARTMLFDRDPVALIELILDESALRRDIGSKAIMREQYRHLAQLAQRRNVTVQVLPFDCGLTGENPGVRGGMYLAETRRHERLVYMEQQDESLLISDPTKVSTYSQRYAKIRAQALGPRESLGLIERLAGDQQ